MKPILRQYFWVVLLVLLSACGKQTVALPTETPIPTVVLPTSVPTSTSILIIIAPSPLPEQTQPIPTAITADSIQVERWKEYEAALAKALFRSSFIPGEFLCEWEILGRSDKKVYVWTVCMSIFPVGSAGLPYNASIPAVIHIEADGSLQSVEIPGGGTNYASDIRRMFPQYAQERYFEGLIHFQELTDHLNWRREHPEELPLIVLSSTSTLILVMVTPSPMPTAPIIPIITPDPIQVERWQEYEEALAKSLLSFLPPEEVLCEWEILGRSEQEVYVWATCDALGGGHGAASSAVIYLNADGTVQSVEKPGSGSKRISNILKMFPPDIQEIILNNLMSYRQLSDHLEWRQEHSEEPPLIVFLATPTP